jgi:glutamate--cysteine ligase
VTPTFEDSDALCSYLDDLHRFVYRHVGEELLWGASVCAVAGEDDLPIARYGRSHAGLFKTVYRRGLRTRYGGVMQAIAGVHFNYSFPVAFWPLYADVLESRDSGSAFVSARYFDLLRNFRRYGWLVSWLFGASPALDTSFLGGRGASGLEPLDPHTLAGRAATSLRMSTIGYRNRTGNAADVEVSVNGLPQYLADLQHAMRTPHAPFAALGVCVDGEYRQINANLLQIENEYYSPIRRKRAPHRARGTAHALARAGVEYVEVRALDVDPAFASGVSPVTLRLLEALLACACSRTARRSNAANSRHSTATRAGRPVRSRAGRAAAARRARRAASPPGPRSACWNCCRAPANCSMRAARSSPTRRHWRCSANGCCS